MKSYYSSHSKNASIFHSYLSQAEPEMGDNMIEGNVVTLEDRDLEHCMMHQTSYFYEGDQFLVAVGKNKELYLVPFYDDTFYIVRIASGSEGYSVVCDYRKMYPVVKGFESKKTENGLLCTLHLQGEDVMFYTAERIELKVSGCIVRRNQTYYYKKFYEKLPMYTENMKADAGRVAAPVKAEPVERPSVLETTTDTAGRSSILEPTQNTTGQSSILEPTQNTIGQSSILEPTQNTIGQSSILEPTQNTTGQSSILEPTQNTTGQSSILEPTQNTTGQPSILEPTQNTTGQSSILDTTDIFGQSSVFGSGGKKGYFELSSCIDKLSGEQKDAIAQLLKEDKKIQAVKMIKDNTELSLEESKEVADNGYLYFNFSLLN